MRGQLEKQLAASRWLHTPLRENPACGAEARWRQKPVHASRALPLAASLQALRLAGPGTLGVDGENPCPGDEAAPGSLFLEFAPTLPVQNPSGRAYSTSEITLPLGEQDVSAYNRLSVWVYVQAEGGSNFVTLALHNAGPEVMPVPGRFEGYHTATVEAGAWHRILWELPDVCRTRATAITLAAQAVGSPYFSHQRVRFYFGGLRLEAVDADGNRGFALREGAVAYCHSGYRAGWPKQVLVQQAGGPFCLRGENGAAVYEGVAQEGENGCATLDFTAFNTPGWYTLHMGGLQTPPFPIGPQAYLGAAWKTLNFFFAQRCGFTVPGIHAECHLDVMSRHPDGRQKCVAGGWHDAGDLTQDGRNTAECTLAMLELAAAARGVQPALYARALEEARWGLDWLLRVRWGDGYRHCGRIIGFWTDNIIGGTDDIITPAENRPYDNLLAAQVMARAAMFLQEEDAHFARLCARCAREDFLFGMEWMHRTPEKSYSIATPLQLNAQAALAAAQLYEAFGEAEHLEHAVRFAAAVMRCQCQAPPAGFALPLCGFFYEDESRRRAQAYFHRSYEHVPLQALAALVRLAPGHAQAARWRQSLALYAGYLKAIAPLAPYGVLPAGVYELNNADFTNLYHEGDRAAGAPSMEEYNAQVKNGIRLDETHYLRIFPVAFQFRGFHAPIMAKAIAALELADVLGDEALRPLALRQAEWMLGRNPFACSSVYGEGHGYHPLYTGMMPQIVGAVPVGFETYKNEDAPYYPVQNLPTYKEIWVHTTGRLMKLLAAFGFEAEDNEVKGGTP